MGKRYTSEEQVKKALKISSFRNLSKAKVMKFISLIPQMEKEVAIAIINQFPIYAEQMANMVVCLKEVCEKILESNDKSQSKAIDAYNITLDTLKKKVEDRSLSVEDQKQFAAQMVEIADKIADLDRENKNFLLQVLTICASVVGGIAVLVTVLLGGGAEARTPAEPNDDFGDDDFKDDPPAL